MRNGSVFAGDELVNVTADKRALEEWEREQAMITQGKRRTVELSALLDDVINEDLAAGERRVIVEHWFNGKKLADIAREFGVNRSSVVRTYGKAMGKIERILRHVVKYQHDVRRADFTDRAVEAAFAVLSDVKNYEEDD